MILNPGRADILWTMPPLRSLGFHFGRDATKMPRLSRCRLTIKFSDRRWQRRFAGTVNVVDTVTHELKRLAPSPPSGTHPE